MIVAIAVLMNALSILQWLLLLRSHQFRLHF